jgi:hypothetical protein
MKILKNFKIVFSSVQKINASPSAPEYPNRQWHSSVFDAWQPKASTISAWHDKP